MKPLCDFCSATPVVATRHCTPGVIAEINGIVHEDKDGLWAACDPCNAMIQLGQWEDLLVRSFANWIAMWGEINDADCLIIGLSHEYFRRHQVVIQ